MDSVLFKPLTSRLFSFLSFAFTPSRAPRGPQKKASGWLQAREKIFEKGSKWFESNHSPVRKITHTSAIDFKWLPMCPGWTVPVNSAQLQTIWFKRSLNQPKMQSEGLEVTLATVFVQNTRVYNQKRSHRFDLHGKQEDSLYPCSFLVSRQSLPMKKKEQVFVE